MVPDGFNNAFDSAAFPHLHLFVSAYLHQDMALEGGVDGAVACWRADMPMAAVRALAEEWSRFLATTSDRDLAARALLLEEYFGGAWAPQSEDELAALTRALADIA